MKNRTTAACGAAKGLVAPARKRCEASGRGGLWLELTLWAQLRSQWHRLGTSYLSFTTGHSCATHMGTRQGAHAPRRRHLAL